MSDSSVSRDLDTVLNRWKHDFSSLFQTSKSSPHQPENGHETNHQNLPDMNFNSHISIVDVRNALLSVNRGKASGIDIIPVEVLNNDTCI